MAPPMAEVAVVALVQVGRLPVQAELVAVGQGPKRTERLELSTREAVAVAVTLVPQRAVPAS